MGTCNILGAGSMCSQTRKKVLQGLHLVQIVVACIVVRTQQAEALGFL